MALRFCSFATGSSGNSYLIRTETTALVVDTGISGKRIFEGLSGNGLSPDDIDGIFITHEHTDHVQSLRTVSKKSSKASVYGSRGTLEALSGKFDESKASAIHPDDGSFVIGDIEVEPFRLSHDAAEPLGYSFTYEGRRLTIITDTGFITKKQAELIEDSDLLVLEANHERNILLMGNYPYSLKMRILGNNGHISNEDAAECLITMLRNRNKPEMPRILLAHLSRENNSPGQAFLTIKNRLFDEDFFENDSYALDVIPRDEMSEVYEV